MIKLSKPFIGKEEIEAVQKVIESNCTAGTCPEVTEFENEFADFVGSKFAVATSSCTTALYIACRALGIEKGSLAVCPDYTFPATGFAPIYAGAIVDIIDVHQDTFNINMDNLSDRYSPDVIIPVHCFGNPADMDIIREYCNDTNAKIIEDAACAVPAYHRGKHAGTIGDIGCYSFYAAKNLCTGEGGMLVTDNEETAKRAKSLCDFGKTTTKPLPKFTQLGYNFRLSAIQAAMGRAQLKKLPWMHRQRMRIAKHYNDFIIDSARPQYVEYGCESAYQRYTVVLREDICRDEVISRMESLGVQTAIGTYSLSEQPYFNRFKGRNPIGKMLFEQSLSLPMYPEMTEDEVNKVCYALKECINNI